MLLLNAMYSSKPSHLNRSNAKRWITLACASLTIGCAIASTTTIPALSQPTNLSGQVRRTPSPEVMQAIRQAVKRQFGVSTINLVSATEQSWPDGCLGLPRGKEGCTMAIVPGWRVDVSDNLQTWVYRSDRTGNILRLENPDRTVLPQPIASKLIQQVAKDTKTPASSLRIAEVRSQQYNGCLGIYRPNQACTEIAMKGWQAIVTSPTQTLIYHLTANQIVQNETASGAKRTVRVSFENFGDIAPIAANEVFHSSSSGDLTGRMSRTVLTQDGKVTRYQSSPTARFAPVVIKTLSATQLAAFKQVLETHQFPNLNGLSYLTAAALADYPTTTYQSPYTATQFIDLEKKNLPRSLQQVITRWEVLIGPGKPTV
jgi:hypothetical protein